jgi:ATP-dependent Lhr-like helicase
MVSEGSGRGQRRGAYLHRDRVNGRLRPRRGARIAAVTSGGAIPELGDYRVVTETDRTFVGSVNEDFALESMAGDVFILGNTSWRIRYVRAGEVVVNDAQSAPATIPFWLGEAPARTIELSDEVSRLRRDLADCIVLERSSSPLRPSANSAVEEGGEVTAADAERRRAKAREWLSETCGVAEWPAQQAVDYVAAQQAAIGLVPTQKQIVFERFFDESGGMQLVIHSPYGGRINRAWGLAMRKRFCRSFDFELQASADDNGIVLALGPQHSFPIDQLFKMLRPDNGSHMLTQALLAVPLFQTRFRWNATRALAVLRFSGGKKVQPYLQRFRSDDLLTAVFPACTACLENRPEDLPVPDHPLVRQTVHDCLHEAMDLNRWLGLLGDIETGRVELVARDTREPSPFSHQLLNMNPYAFLDPAPLEERRTRAVQMRRSFTVDSVRDLGRLDAAAIAQVRGEAWPVVRDADELHDTLLVMTALPAREGEPWSQWFRELVDAGRATELRRDDGPSLWVSTERLPLVLAALPAATPQPTVAQVAANGEQHSQADAWIALVRGRLECLGPQTATQIARDMGLELAAVHSALESLEGEGFALRGQFEECSRELGVGSRAESGPPLPPTANSLLPSPQWCERRLLARIHRLTLDGLRRQIQPVGVEDFIRFLIDHQHVSPGTWLSGRRAVVDVVEQLQGFEIPAGAWEQEILPARIKDYDPSWLDELSLSGQVAWGRLEPPRRNDDGPARAMLTRVVPIAMAFREDMSWLVSMEQADKSVRLRAGAQAVFDALTSRGALFASDLQEATRLLPAQLEESLRELAALGLVTADGFAAIRSIVARGQHRVGGMRRLARWGRLTTRASSSGGRWSLFARPAEAATPDERAERWAALLLRRYGVVFRDLLTRESAAPAWRELARVYRRLEARGELRGGRFVAGVAGEQFASDNAVERLRRVRDEGASTGKADGNGQSQYVVLAAADPVNLFGVVVPGPRVPAVRGNRLLLDRGRLVASIQGGKVLFHDGSAAGSRDEWTRWLRLSGQARTQHTPHAKALLTGAHS